MSFEVKNLSVGYQTPRGFVRALSGVDLAVAAGEIVGLVGESGCGKSTLASTAIRVLPAEAEIVEGSVSLDGEDLLSSSEPAIRAIRGDRISIVFQNPAESLHPLLTIGAQMVDIQHRSSDPRASKLLRAAEMLRCVGVADAERRLEHYAHQLSGGTLQRVAVAMALLTRPRLLIADEPTAAVDAVVEAQILAYLERFRSETGCSILLISHHLGVIERLCDSMVVLYAGQVVESGSVENIFENPRHPYTRLLLACDPAKADGEDGLLPTIPGELPNLVGCGADRSGGCVFEPRCPDAIERCRAEIPRMTVGPEGSVRCHRAEELS